MLLFRQIAILAWKNILITLVRHPISTPLRAFILPVVFGWFLAFARNLFIGPAYFGVGSPHPVRSLQDAFGAVSGGRNTLAIVNGGRTGGEIERVVNQIAGVAVAQGREVTILPREDDLVTTCRSSLRGATHCMAGIVFHSSPNEGPDGMWNYTIRADGSLGSNVFVDRTNNDQQIYILPLQHAVDFAIAGGKSSAPLPSEVDEIPYTALTNDERNTVIRTTYMKALISLLAVAFFVAICGIIYQQVGLQAVERESKMAQLMECMMPNKQRWLPQVARLLSYHFGFALMFLPGWIAMSFILKIGVFQQSNIAIQLVLHILTGLSLASWSLFGASFFRRAQLSGISWTIFSLVLAIIAQVYSKANSGTVAVTSLLFPPMTYTYSIIFMARWEAQNEATILTSSAPHSHSPPDGEWLIPGLVLWLFLLIQIIVYPLLAIFVERWLFGVSSSARQLDTSGNLTVAVELRALSKEFQPTAWARLMARVFRRGNLETVRAVNSLNLQVLPGQIVGLLGANGSGKSTTLDAIAGLNQVTSGAICVDFQNGLGFCPQQNVLWKELTVYEHVSIFNRLKSTGQLATQAEKEALIRSCDLDRKIKAKASSLSGGQMRKLQLTLMFIGGSKVCLVDECSSGVDALARRKLQDILLDERSRSNRSIIFTTHFLDEADFLSDYIVIMSKGSLKVEGTGPEIKHALGKYRIHLYHNTSIPVTRPYFEGVETKELFDQTIYMVPDSTQVAEVLNNLENQGLKDYQVSGPQIEDAFMAVAEEMTPADTKKDRTSITDDSDAGSGKLKLLSGTRIKPWKQAWTLFRKRATVFRRNVLPNLAAVAIPIAAAGLASLFLTGFPAAGCDPIQTVQQTKVQALASEISFEIVAGPANKLSKASLDKVLAVQPAGFGNHSVVNASSVKTNFHLVNTFDEFTQYLNDFQGNVTPGGFYLGDANHPPAFAWEAGDVGSSGRPSFTLAWSTIMQNLLDINILNTTIATQFAEFNAPWQANQGNTLQFTLYFGLAVSIAPAFFALYPCMERLRKVRALHFSNGVRATPLWMAYAAFDFLFVLIGSALVTIVLQASTSVWYHVGHLFVVLFLYGLTGLLFAYVVSIFARSQLSAFAVAAGGNALMFLLYIIAYLVTLTYVPINKVDSTLNTAFFAMGVFLPAANLARALFVTLNMFSVLCTAPNTILSNAGDLHAFGGPILYLILQSIVMFTFLVWYEGGYSLANLFRRKSFREPDVDEKDCIDDEIAEETKRVTESTEDGLRVLHLTKAYGKNVAVQDISFGVKRGEVFALLGPNGAGKSTTISVIRGDILPSNNGGQVYIEGINVLRQPAIARQHLGVCPQFDATDQLTVLEHLRFYARVRGVPDVGANVRAVIRAVGLEAFESRMAAALSGGNRRKLSLAIALVGNPSVLLLDEPSSGMDVAAKRIMWRTLAGVVGERSIVLTTHSMEEADALANRAGIMAKSMLALGTTDFLRNKNGERYHVHILLQSAPYTTTEETDRVKSWITETFDGAQTDQAAFHGQIRFSVPAIGTVHSVGKPEAGNDGLATTAAATDDTISPNPAPEYSVSSPPALASSPSRRSGIAALFSTLEAAKAQRGFEYYSVSQTTLDQVFLDIVGRHNVQEENYRLQGEETGEKKAWARRLLGPRKSS